MARKIIKAILFILAAVVVAGGIMTYLRSQKKVTSPLQTQTEKAPQQAPVKSSEIQEITVSAQGQGQTQSAQVQIKGINEHNYNIQHIASGDGFKILVPNAQIGQVKPLLDKPHPLIKKITVHTSPDNPNMAELVFETQKDVNFLDTQKNDTLTIDFVKAEGSVDDKMSDSSAGTSVAGKGTSKTKVTGANKSPSSTLNDDFAGTTSAKSKAAASKSSKSAKKKGAAIAKSSKKSKKSSSVKLKPFVPDEDTGSGFDDSTLNNLAADEQGSINDMKNSQNSALNDFGGAAAPSTEPMMQEEAPTIAEPSAPKKNTDAEEGFMNLNDAVKEEPKAAPKGNANLLDAETEMSLTENTGKTGNQQMAALPNQKVDVNQLKANLPALQSMNVTRSGNNTVVTFDREKSIPFKVFRMVNPSRVVVDFKDAKSNLKSDYPRFTGTKISRIETREYAGMDGLLVRVIMYVDGAPNFTSNKNGNQLVIELQ